MLKWTVFVSARARLSVKGFESSNGAELGASFTSFSGCKNAKLSCERPSRSAGRLDGMLRSCLLFGKAMDNRQPQIEINLCQGKAGRGPRG